MEILNKLPNELADLVRQYRGVNTIAYAAIRKYYNSLFKKKELYEEFVWSNYVYPQCNCNNCPNNGVKKLYKRKDCDQCFRFESTFIYTPNDFIECITDNPQYQKIMYYPQLQADPELGDEYYNDDRYDDYVYYGEYGEDSY